MQRGLSIAAILAVVIAFGLILAKNSPVTPKDSLLNVSYDPTRELYQTLNPLFEAKQYLEDFYQHARVLDAGARRVSAH